MTNEKNCKDECKIESKKSTGGLKTGIIAALIPHIGCILFIVFTLLGISAGAVFLKNFLTMAWAFPALIGFSFLLAGISSYFYLKRNCCVNKSKYLSILFGSVILINILLFFVVFPWAANISGKSTQNFGGLEELKLKVAIPCSGHAALIIDELKKAGVNDVAYSLPNIFDMHYDSSKITKEQLLNLEVFNSYRATVI